MFKPTLSLDTFKCAQFACAVVKNAFVSRVPSFTASWYTWRIFFLFLLHSFPATIFVSSGLFHWINGPSLHYTNLFRTPAGRIFRGRRAGWEIRAAKYPRCITGEISPRYGISPCISWWMYRVPLRILEVLYSIVEAAKFKISWF